MRHPQPEAMLHWENGGMNVFHQAITAPSRTLFTRARLKQLRAATGLTDKEVRDMRRKLHLLEDSP